MKSSLLLIPAILLTVACSPNSDKSKSKSNSAAPSEVKIVTTPGPEGYINLYIGAEADQAVAIPDALSFSTSSGSDHFTLKPFSWLYFERDQVKDRNALSFGCDDSREMISLPEVIAADQVSICGKVSFHGVQLKIKANTLKFDNAEISIETHDDQEKGIFDLVEFTANNVVVVGTNSLTAQSTFNNDQFSAPPPIAYIFGKVSGSGSLHTVSQAHTYTQKVK